MESLAQRASVTSSLFRGTAACPAPSDQVQRRGQSLPRRTISATCTSGHAGPRAAMLVRGTFRERAGSFQAASTRWPRRRQPVESFAAPSDAASGSSAEDNASRASEQGGPGPSPSPASSSSGSAGSSPPPGGQGGGGGEEGGPRGNVLLAGASVAAGVLLFLATRFGGGGPDLRTLAATSTPYDLALTNDKSTLVEFYADWCEVCRESAGDVYNVEQQFKDSVNFVMLNIDNVKWAEEINEFGVEGIPHFTFLDKKGNELGYVVGRLPRKVLQANLAAMARGEERVPFSEVVGEYSTAEGKTSAPSIADPRSHGR